MNSNNKTPFKTVIKFTLPSNSLKPLSIEYVNDINQGISANNDLDMKEYNLKHGCTCKVYYFYLTSKISNISLVYLLPISVLMTLYSQVGCQYWLTRKMKH